MNVLERGLKLVKMVLTALLPPWPVRKMNVLERGLKLE